ncbi:uncharacterized protein [Polyergus mexicanus]|uniref:uncharacterized protein isoform X2 n=1 Tax=Polyergus mexicanus TaxID=615972 RepID=UPI0038B6656B
MNSNKILLPRNDFINFRYRPKRRTPLESYMRRLSLQYVYPDSSTVINKQILAKIYTISVLHTPSVSKHQRSIKLTTLAKTELRKSSHCQSSKLEQEKKRFFCSLISLVNILVVIIICSVIIGVILYVTKKNTMQPINSHTSVLFKFVENIKAVYYNQESDIWNNVSYAINKVISRASRKIPLIILLFSNETTTMDSLAIVLAYASSNALNANNFLCLNPENFGDNAGKIIDILKERFLAKTVVVSYDNSRCFEY